MKNLKQYLFDKDCDNIILTEMCNIDGERMINEAFKLPILSKLAAKIKEYESEKHARDVQKAEEYRKEGRSYTPTPTAETFASLFGPIVMTSRYGSSEKKVRGCRWDKLTDENVTYFEGGYEGALHKLIKKLYTGAMYGMLIVCDPDTDDIVYVVRGYNNKDSKGKPYKPATWKFKEWTSSTGEKHKNIEHETVYKKRRWGADYNLEELIEVINDYSVYFITIPNEYIEEYNVLTADRKEAQKGIVNYDKKSLETLAKNQRAHYRALAKELRAQRLESNPMYMFDEITDVQNKVNELYKKIASKPEYVEQFYDIGDLMQYTGRAFEYFFKYIRANQKHNTRKKEVEAEGRDYTGSWYKEEASEALEDCKENLDRIKKNMAEIEQRLSEIK